MKYIIKLKLKLLFWLFVVIGLFSSCGVFLQKTGVKNYTLKEEINSKEYNDYQYDFVYLTRLLEIGFPKINDVFPEKERQKEKERIIKALSGKSVGNKEFIVQTKKYLSRFHNQHTSINLGINFQKVYPFLVIISNDKWVLINADKTQDSLLIGKEITKINDIEISEVEKRLCQFTFAENKINQQCELMDWTIYNKPDFLKESNVIRELSEEIKVLFNDGSVARFSPTLKEDIETYKIKVLTNEVTKVNSKTYSYTLYPEQNFGYLQFNKCHDKIDILEGIESYVKPWLQPFARGYVKRQFKKEKPSKMFAPYYNPEHPVFKDFVWELVDSLNRSNIQNLIIDLRNNQGGNLTLGVQLLYFLTDNENLKGFTNFAYTSDIYRHYFSIDYRELQKEYTEENIDNKLLQRKKSNNLFSEIVNPDSKYYIPNYRPIFKGRVFVLANYGTGSAAALLTTLFQDNNLGVVIGTSVGNNPIGATTHTPMKLPKTKAVVSIATTFQERPNKEKGEVQIPDYWVEFTINDLFLGIDPYLEKAKALINEAQ